MRGTLENGRGGSANWWTFAPISLLLKATGERGRSHREISWDACSLPKSIFARSNLVPSAFTMCVRFLGQHRRSPCGLQWHSTTQKYLSCMLQGQNGVFQKRFKVTPYCCLMDVLWRANRIHEATLAGTCTHTLCLSRETAGQWGWKPFYLKVRTTGLNIHSVNRFKHFSLVAFGVGGSGYSSLKC